MQNSFIRNFKIQQFVKALTKPYPGQDIKEHPAASSNRSSQTSATPKASGSLDAGLPVGTIHNGRIKIAANPSKWVDYHTGHSYGDVKSDQHDKVENHPQLKPLMDSTVQKMSKNLLHEDVKVLEGKLKTWMNLELKAKNLQAAGNVNTKSGAHVSPSAKRYHEVADQASTAKKDFHRYLDSAKLRAKKSHGKEA